MDCYLIIHAFGDKLDENPIHQIDRYLLTEKQYLGFQKYIDGQSPGIVRIRKIDNYDIQACKLCLQEDKQKDKQKDELEQGYKLAEQIFCI
jgi:hypothetical protein